MVQPAHINLVPIEPRMLTSYVSRRFRDHSDPTRLRGGRLANTNQLMAVGAYGEATAHMWRLATSAACDLVRLDEAVVRNGGARLRLTEAWRSWKIQDEGNRKFLHWVSAGRPGPKSAKFNPSTMKNAYVAAAGESNHGWGGAIDIDVDAIEFPGCGRGTDAALARLWSIARAFGWYPVITEPNVDQSEAWHFDHLGGLHTVRRLLADHVTELSGISPYKMTALVGGLLANSIGWKITNPQVRYLQARLIAGGHWPGVPDGLIGPKTVEALRAATGEKSITRRMRPNQLIMLLNEHEVGYELMARC